MTMITERYVARVIRSLMRVLLLLCLLSCGAHAQEESTGHRVISIAPSEDAAFRLQQLVIEAQPGDVIQLEQGTYRFTRQIDIAASHLTLRGRGSDKTILSFRGQDAGGQGIEATGDAFVIEGLAVEDTLGNAIKVLGANHVTFRDVRTEWTGPPSAENGAYGIYPVQCRNVLIENCTAIGASDAGIYVGQSYDVIVRNCRAERNVAGIEIENTVRADVYDNLATNNTGGILVFDLPGLQVKAGRQVRVFRNRVEANNHRNFAMAGNIVAMVPAGTGMMVLATDEVEIFDNDIADNQTTGLAIVSYLIAGKTFNDPAYDPYPESLHVHGNRFARNGSQPSGELGTVLRPVLGVPFPDILFDGVQNPQRLVNGSLPESLQPTFAENGELRFANFHFDKMSLVNVATGKYRVERDVSGYAATKQPLAAATLADPPPVAPAANAALQVYRAAPRRLSEYGLFREPIAAQQPADNVLPYELNTALFSDYTLKRRFIRIPAGTTIEYREQGVLEFPVGTVIAKTFSYLHDERDPTAGERLLETRIETRTDDGWYGYTYVWDDEQTDAALALGGGELQAEWTDAHGTKRTNRYQIPNVNQCLNCHQKQGEFIPIGPTAGNLHRDHLFGTEGGGEPRSQNQLQYLAQRGWLTGSPDDLSQIDRWPQADNPAQDVALRARAWLEVNCAHCHSPSGTARTSGLDLRWSQQNLAKLGVMKTPVAAGHGSGGHSYDIVPGKPDESILLHRIASDDPSIAMPNVGRRMVPVEGVALIRAWIAGMEPAEQDDAKSP